MSSDTRLPIRDLCNANPAWLRSRENLRNLDALARSLAKSGMLQPVLVRPDFVVLDGARRLLAAEKLGWTEVPVVMANSWSVVKKYYAQLNELEAELPGLNVPLHWVELDELWSVLFKPVHQATRTAQAVTERRRRAKLRQQGLTEKKVVHHDSDAAYTGYVIDLADMFKMRPIHVKLIRDIFHSYRVLQKQDPAALGPFQKLLAMGEQYGIQTSSTIRMYMRNVRGGMSVQEAEEKARHSLGNAFGAPWRKTRRVKEAHAELREVTAHVSIGKETVQNLTKLLDQISLEASRFHEFAVDQATVGQISIDVRIAVNRINAMRRRLEAHGNQLQGESK